MTLQSQVEIPFSLAEHTENAGVLYFDLAEGCQIKMNLWDTTLSIDPVILPQRDLKKAQNGKCLLPFWMVIHFNSVRVSMDAFPPSLPIPLAFTPPNGAYGSS